MKRSLKKFFPVNRGCFDAHNQTQGKCLADIENKVEALNKTINQTSKITAEVLWAQTFNNTTANSEWLVDRTFSPGRWAVGYPYLYVLYRVLNQFKPRQILELGLGQTTRMIGSYTARFGAAHDLVEHDEEWMAFFKTSGYTVPDATKIHQLPLIERQYLDDDKVTAYGNFRETFTDRKFDLISIDAPFGGQAKKYSRVDVLELLPDCLCDSFVIMIDDYNRAGEKNTVELIKKALDDKMIPYSAGGFRGEKELMIIVSKDNKFFCSM